MLGQRIEDPDGIEGPPVSVPGLGHLDVVTVMKPEKRLALTQATYLETGDAVEGYEIHLGETTGPDCAHAWLRVGDRPEGAASASGRVRGAYLHGLFASDSFRSAFLAGLGARSDLSYGADVEATLDALAAHLEAYMDLDLLFSLSADIPTQSKS
jgi:adenosylcobyric acid synthase